MHRAKRGPDILRLASQVIENLRGTPFVMALLVINIIVLAGFAFAARSWQCHRATRCHPQGLYRLATMMIRRLL
jgi:hypothetical protein